VARALIAQGHRMIGIIGGPPLLTTTRDRLHGFRDGLHEAGLSLPPLHIVEADFTRDGGYAAALELSVRAPGITAIFALNDPMAVGTLSALRERGLRVPDDISVVGFDNIPMTCDTTPTLSTVHVPMVEMGARAMELALARDASEWRVEHFATRLVLRGSTAVAAQLHRA
jgi:LacI family transcriptional regulator